MMISEEKIKEFQKNYKQKFGKNISKKQAYEQGIKLVNLLGLVIKSSHKKMTQKNIKNTQ